jgi:hypothetical protein
VLADYKNSCLAPAGTLAGVGSPLQFWGRLNAPSICNYNGETVSQGANKGSLSVTGIANLSGSLNNNAFPGVTNTFTMEFWVNPGLAVNNPMRSSQYLFAGVDDQPPYAIFPYGGGSSGLAGAGVSVGQNGLTVYEHADGYLPNILSVPFTMTSWTHVAVVYQNKVPNVYINGVLKTNYTTPSVKTTVCPSYNFGGSAYGVMPGNLDEVRIWNYARSASEIAGAYNRSLSPGEKTGLIGYWPMDNSNGNTFHDVSCGANNAQTFTAPAEGWVASGAPVNETNYIEFANRWVVPNHGLPTNYVYNSLNSLIKQTTPDAGTTNFVYDRLGRQVISQNAEQLQPTVVSGQPTDVAGRYSYTRYDLLGRIVEVGEKLGAGIANEATGRDDNLLTGWYNSGSNRQVTITAYDEAPTWVQPKPDQKNLRNRIAAIALLSQGSDPTQNRQAATYCSYDIDGNMSDQVQENAALAANESQMVIGSNGLKHIEYEYDLISGKVKKVRYQDGKWDQFYYQYKYDDNNRLIAAYSNRANDISLDTWTKDAGYTFYHHGPRARLSLGRDSRVQGVDYAYTLQGWVKGTNGEQLATDGSTITDIGGDGAASSAYSFVSRDAMAYSLNYFKDDYKPIGGAGAKAFGNQYTPSFGSSLPGVNLFNGNIGSATYAIAPFEYQGATGGSTGFKGYSYRYDQLNRLTAMNYHVINPYTTAAGWDNSSINADHDYGVLSSQWKDGAGGA